MRRTATTLAVFGLLAAPTAAQAGPLSVHATGAGCDNTFRLDATANPKGKHPKGQMRCVGGIEGPVTGLSVVGNVAYVTVAPWPRFKFTDGPDTAWLEASPNVFFQLGGEGLDVTVSH